MCSKPKVWDWQYVLSIPTNGYYNPMDIIHKQKNTSKETLNIKH